MTSTTKPSLSPARIWLLWLLLILLVAAAIEAMAALTYYSVILPRVPYLVWNPDLDQARKAWLAEESVVDRELGWPLSTPSSLRDATGAKANDDFPQPGHACASAYGDSFVWGEEVPPRDGWIEQLARGLGCRVSNYGVTGYGTDQALLRFRRLVGDESPIVMLAIFPEDVMRNVNQYRAFLGYPVAPSMLKGRFLLDAHGQLEWLPRPQLDEQGFVRLNAAPSMTLPHDYMLPDTRDGRVTFHLPYTLTMIRLALLPSVRVHFSRRPATAEFFSPDHPSGALALTVALAEAFTREASLRGKRPLVLLLPGANSFYARDNWGDFEYSPLVRAMRARDVDVVDLGTMLPAALGGQSYCVLFVRANCSGHYGVAGGKVVADVVAGELRRRGLLQ